MSNVIGFQLRHSNWLPFSVFWKRQIRDANNNYLVFYSGINFWMTKQIVRNNEYTVWKPKVSTVQIFDIGIIVKMTGLRLILMILPQVDLRKPCYDFEDFLVRMRHFTRKTAKTSLTSVKREKNNFGIISKMKESMSPYCMRPLFGCPQHVCWHSPTAAISAFKKRRVSEQIERARFLHSINRPRAPRREKHNMPHPSLKNPITHQQCFSTQLHHAAIISARN